MTPNRGDALELLELAREGARCRRYRGLEWGFAISTDRIIERDVPSPDDRLLGEVGLKACTLAGEQLWLTPRLVDSLGPVILQGECRAFVYWADPTAGYDEPLSELLVVLCPAPSPEHFEGYSGFQCKWTSAARGTAIVAAARASWTSTGFSSCSPFNAKPPAE